MNTSPSTTLLYPSNATVAELTHSERLLLMTLRLWALPHRHQQNIDDLMAKPGLH